MNRSLLSFTILAAVAGCSGEIDLGEGSRNTPLETDPAKADSAPVCNPAYDVTVTPGMQVGAFALAGQDFVFYNAPENLVRLYTVGPGKPATSIAEIAGPDGIGSFTADATHTAWIKGVYVPNEESGSMEWTDVVVRSNATGNAITLPRPAGQNSIADGASGVRGGGLVTADGAVYWESLRTDINTGKEKMVVVRWDGATSNDVVELPYGSMWIVAGSELFFAERRPETGSPPQAAIRVGRVPVTGGTPTDVKTLPPSSIIAPLPYLIGVRSGRLYAFFDEERKTLSSISVDGADEKTIPDAPPGLYVLGKDHLFVWSESSTSILRIPVDGSSTATTLVASEDKVRHVAVDACNVYWSNGTTIRGRAQSK